MMMSNMEKARIKALRAKARGELIALAIVIAAVAIPLTIIGGVFFIAIHFILKFW